MSLLGECRDINGLAIKHGLVFMAGPGECHQCTCESGVPKHCQDVMCHQPQNCSTFRKGARCCDFVCLDDIPPVKTDVVSLEGDFGLRLVASVITAILSFSLLFFLVHRLRQRKIRTGRQNRQLSEDERSLGSIGYITGSLGYLPGAMERYEEPSAHFPHYPLWKPPGNYFPRGEAPPPYEEAVAATRAEALAAAMASGSLHASAANFNRDSAHLGINYNTYSTGSLLAGSAHRTIPMNLATSASFTLQPERFDEAPASGGTSSVSVAAGTVSVTATVTAPSITRSDPIQITDQAHRTSTLRRNDFGHRADMTHRSDTGHWSDIVHRSDSAHRSDLTHRSESSHRPEVHRSDMSHRTESNHRNDMVHRAEVTHRPDSNHPRIEPIQHANLRPESHRPDLSHRPDFGHREAIQRDGIRRADASIITSHHRSEERRLPSMPPPENSLSLPSSHHPHGTHHSVLNYSHVLSHTQPHQSHHQPASAHSHSFGHQHQLHVQAAPLNIPGPMPVLDIPAPLLGTDLVEREEHAAVSSKLVIPPVTSVPKSGTGVYEDILVGPPSALSVVESYNPATYTATLRRGKHSVSNSGGNSSIRRGPVPVATPTLTPSLIPVPPLVTNSSLSASSPITIPPPPIPSPEHMCENNPASNSIAVTAAVAALVAASPPRCTCSKTPNPRCTCPGSCHSSITSLAVSDSAVPQDSNLSLSQAGIDDNDDYRSECENCKSTHSSNYYLDAEEPEPEITMTLHRKPTETGEENGNSYYRTSLTLPTRHRVVPLHGTTSSCGARDNWFSSMPESSTDESEEE